MAQCSIEQWREYPSDPRYLVSDQGRVRMKGRSVRAPSTTPRHYQVIVVKKNSRPVGYYVHQMVLEAFVGPRPGKFTISHLNGNPRDNRLVNLCYESQRDNCLRRVEHHTDFNGEKSKAAKLSWKDVRDIRASSLSQNALAKKYHVARITIQRIIHQVCWNPKLDPLVNDTDGASQRC